MCPGHRGSQDYEEKGYLPGLRQEQGLLNPHMLRRMMALSRINPKGDGDGKSSESIDG